jgi:hypothetical protein
MGVKLDNEHWCVHVPTLETIPKSREIIVWKQQAQT